VIGNGDMRKMPMSLRREMEADPYYDRCCVTGQHKKETKIDWHHNLIFAGRQVNEKWCILPLAREVHDRVHEKELKDYVDWLMLNRATEAEIITYSKAVDLAWRKEQLDKKYAHKKNIPVL